jgi:hypothetical protein
MTEGFSFLDASSGDNDGPLATWQPGPGYQRPPRPFVDPRFLADPAAASAEEGQVRDARRARLEAAGIRYEDYAQAAAALPGRDSRRHVGDAWLHVTAGRYGEADQELRLALQDCGDGPAWQLLTDLRRPVALARAVSSGDAEQVLQAARDAAREWSQPGALWPDNWRLWQQALDDALPPDRRVDLHDLAGAPRPVFDREAASHEMRAAWDLGHMPAEQISAAVGRLDAGDVAEIRDILGFQSPGHGIDFGPQAGLAYAACTRRLDGPDTATPGHGPAPAAGPGAAAALEPLGSKTVLGETVWPVLAGRAPGQETGLEHLLWGGPGDAVHLYTGGRADGRMEYPGRVSGTVTGPCATAAQARQAAAAYLAAREQEPAPETVHAEPSAELRAFAAGLRYRADAADETARILAEHGTPEQRLEYALMEAGRRRRGAYAAAQERCKADGETPAAEQRHGVDHEAARAEWTVEVASAVAEYAGEIGATAPDPSSGAEDLGSPYHRGWRNGANMLESDITRRPGAYDDGQWHEYVAGYAEGAQSHADATVALAHDVREQAQQNPAEPASDTASSGQEPGRADGVLSGAPAQAERAGPGLWSATEFPGAPAARPAARTARRPRPASGITSAAGRARPGGLR